MKLVLGMLDYSKPKGEFDILMFTGNPIIKVSIATPLYTDSSV